MKSTFSAVLFSILALLSIQGCHSGKTVGIMAYNVGTFTKFEDSSLRMVASMVKETGADVISLNELDSCTVRTGGVYQL